MTLQHRLTQEVASIDLSLAHGLEMVLRLDKMLYPEWFAELKERTGWPHVSDLGDLTSNDFCCGHFTEVVCVLDNLFGPCTESREACYWLFGYYVGRPRLTREDLNAAVMRQLVAYFTRAGSSNGSSAASIRSR